MVSMVPSLRRTAWGKTVVGKEIVISSSRSYTSQLGRMPQPTIASEVFGVSASFDFRFAY
jgi:hypothetical protein